MSAVLCSNKLQTVKLNPLVCYQLSWTIWARDSGNLEILVGFSESYPFCEASWWCGKDPWKSNWRNFSSSGALDTALWSNGHDMEKNELDAFPTFPANNFQLEHENPQVARNTYVRYVSFHTVFLWVARRAALQRFKKKCGIFECNHYAVYSDAPEAPWRNKPQELPLPPKQFELAGLGLTFWQGRFSGSFRCQLEQP